MCLSCASSHNTLIPSRQPPPALGLKTPRLLHGVSLLLSSCHNYSTLTLSTLVCSPDSTQCCVISLSHSRLNVGHRRMWWAAFFFVTFLVPAHLLRSPKTLTTAISPESCNLTCIRQGGPGCDYCRISSSDVNTALGFNSRNLLGTCVPWPCFKLLGEEDPHLCRHFVQAPQDVNIELVPDTDPNSDTVVVSWKPSQYGISFLRGFQVSLQALGGSGVACQLFLFQRNLTLPASHAQTVYKSDPFPSLSLGSHYAVTVMALPVPEKWEKFYHSKIFSTRSCAEKNGFQHCKADWYPKYTEVQQKGTVVVVTFNLAPPTMGITSYFSSCTANGKTTYFDIAPNYSKNRTHHSFELRDLKEGSNYSCEIAANEVDAVRKRFHFQVEQREATQDSFPYWTMVPPVVLAVAAIFMGFLAVLVRRRWLQRKKPLLIPEIIKQHEDERATEEEMVSLSKKRMSPLRLLICYSSHDGPTHVNAVMHLASFIQQHMATKVFLDIWNSLEVAQEGSMAWSYRHILESDFVLVICSQGLRRRLESSTPAGTFDSEVMARLIGEEVGRAISGGKDLSKYMTAIFGYSEMTDIPMELRLVAHYRLTADLPLLFSHLHQVPLYRPGRYMTIKGISEEELTKTPAGQALQHTITEAEKAMKAKRLDNMEEGCY
ncbi:interleukin-17 receptor D [Dunckerocampus dactyliophorus]|uniref:interleukin-17 receptor D n=1 Tax=Dunckerocampus dactyliophorus TaxID=161453 RepID=UPI002404CE9E|nr:interleukin-17 receptor D [Dunckerocampus dactyliophorus]